MIIYLENYLQKKNLKNISSPHQNFEHYIFSISFSFFEGQFCCKMVKQQNFLRVVNLSFDTRFVKYYQFSLTCHKDCPINTIKVKCSQIAQNVPDIF